LKPRYHLFIDQKQNVAISDIFKQPSATKQALINRANEALYKAKGLGKNCVVGNSSFVKSWYCEKFCLFGWKKE
jgi:predicted signal transduction protein with EAL and GGDEF domain